MVTFSECQLVVLFYSTKLWNIRKSRAQLINFNIQIFFFFFNLYLSMLLHQNLNGKRFFHSFFFFFLNKAIFLMWFQGHCWLNPSHKNLQNTSTLLTYSVTNLTPPVTYITNLHSCRYDWDAATTANFLRKYGLTGNIYFSHHPNVSPSTIKWLWCLPPSFFCRGIQTQHRVQPCHPIWSQVNLMGVSWSHFPFSKFDIYTWNWTCSFTYVVVVIMNLKLQGSMDCWVILMQTLVILKLVRSNPLLSNKLCKF